MQKFEIPGHAPSLLPAGKWKLAWSDEFDGTELDRSKWDFRLSMMGLRHPAWTDRGVRLDGQGNLVFELIEEEGRPVSSQLQTGYNFMDAPAVSKRFGRWALNWQIGKLQKDLYAHKYGYFECRCRLQRCPEAWWSAFWLQSSIIGASLDPGETGAEVDIMECFQYGQIRHHNVISGGYGPDAKRVRTGGIEGIDHSVFHRFGVWWDETGYTFYIDGVEDGRITEDVSHRPEFILITTEVTGYHHEDHAAIPLAYEMIGKDDFLVDYIRVFDPAAE